ncbi:hypothetical protein AAFF_G00141240 [Aldrovandia affinis]|uniref:Uncharacterized protein n=1 Tax=Aldrovandia affinis TaxID=143900 RepID=A0AAD7TCG1_9TELE|nr:hypothetical protein AAFF_G00141240 [Aldrovandia affinis]
MVWYTSSTGKKKYMAPPLAIETWGMLVWDARRVEKRSLEKGLSRGIPRAAGRNGNIPRVLGGTAPSLCKHLVVIYCLNGSPPRGPAPVSHLRGVPFCRLIPEVGWGPLVKVSPWRLPPSPHSVGDRASLDLIYAVYLRGGPSGTWENS